MSKASSKRPWSPTTQNRRPRYKADPLIFRQIAVNMLLDLHDTSTRLLEDSGAVNVPLFVLAAARTGS